MANVLCPATKLWNTGHGSNVMREAVSLMGGYGITEDCPGFLGHKWMDSQLEATYEGPEAVQRRQLSATMTNEVFLAQFRAWIREMRQIAARHPGTGACTLASAMTLWQWTLNHLLEAKDADGAPLYQSNRQGVTFPLADALCWLLASRAQILDVLELKEKGPQNPVVAEGFEGLDQFLTDLCHVQAARAAGEVGRICAELVFGYNRHPSWDGEASSCWREDELVAIDALVPGMSGFQTIDTLEGRRLARRQGRPLRAVRRLQRIRPPALQARWLPDRLATGEGPRRPGAHHGHDPRRPGLSSDAQSGGTSEHGRGHRLRRLRTRDGRLSHDSRRRAGKPEDAAAFESRACPACRRR